LRSRVRSNIDFFVDFSQNFSESEKFNHDFNHDRLSAQWNTLFVQLKSRETARLLSNDRQLTFDFQYVIQSSGSDGVRRFTCETTAVQFAADRVQQQRVGSLAGHPRTVQQPPVYDESLFTNEVAASEPSGQSNLTKRPHSRRTWTVQSYSSGGANVTPI